MPVMQLACSQWKEDAAACGEQCRAPELDNGFCPGCSTSSPGASGYTLELGIMIFTGQLHLGLPLKENTTTPPQSYLKLKTKQLDLFL